MSLLDAPVCIHCGDERMIERISNGWYCNNCGKTSPALSTNDKRFLKGIRVEAQE